MDLLQAIVGRVATEWPLIESAWVSVAGLVVAFFVGGWSLHWALYRAHVTTLRERLDLANDKAADSAEKRRWAEAQIERLQREVGALRRRGSATSAELDAVSATAASTADAIEDWGSANVALERALTIKPASVDFHLLARLPRHKKDEER